MHIEESMHEVLELSNHMIVEISQLNALVESSNRTVVKLEIDSVLKSPVH